MLKVLKAGLRLLKRASEARQKPVRRAMATYSVEELEKMAVKLNHALAEAKDKAEHDEAAKTPISAPKKKNTSARAHEEESNKNSPSSVIANTDANTPQVTDIVADRKSDVALLPSFNALGDGKVTVECVDMFLAPLARANFKEAFITEVTPGTAIPTKTLTMWELIFAELDRQKIPQAKSIAVE